MRGRPFLWLLMLCACGGSPPAPAPSVSAMATTTSAPAATTTVMVTTTALSSTTTTIPKKGSLVIHGVGDVNLDVSYIPALAERGFEWPWSGLDGIFLDDDLTLVNLECSPSPLGDPEPKGFTFRCPEGLSEMAAAGVEVANLANNHSQDFGVEAMLDGRLRLRAAGIKPVGTGLNAAQANGFSAFEVDGWKVGVLGFGGVHPHAGWLATEEGPGMADGDNLSTMTAAVERAEAWADLVVVTVHWGVELDREPRAEDVERAEAMIAAGADVILGHHSHRLQSLDVIEGSPIAWSLGNFVWPNFSPAGSDTAVARVVVSPDGEISSCLLPATIESPGHPVLIGARTCEES